MNIVDRPEFAPGYCIVNCSAEDPGGFIDTGLCPPLVDPRVYVSRQAVIDMGRLFGLPDPDEYQRLCDQLDHFRSRVDWLVEENTRLNRDVEAAEWTLERKFQTKPQAKPGRPRKAQV